MTILDTITEKRAFVRPAIQTVGRFVGKHAPRLLSSATRNVAQSLATNGLSYLTSGKLSMPDARNQRFNSNMQRGGVFGTMNVPQSQWGNLPVGQPFAKTMYDNRMFPSDTPVSSVFGRASEGIPGGGQRPLGYFGKGESGLFSRGLTRSE
jgi:hypothetical protein